LSALVSVDKTCVRQIVSQVGKAPPERCRRNGFAVVWGLFAIFLICGALGIGVDLGYWQAEGTRAQTAAEQSLRAAQLEIAENASAEQAKQAAIAMAKRYGFKADLIVDAQSGLEITVEGQSPAFFTALFGNRAFVVSRRAKTGVNEISGKVAAASQEKAAP
jgi:hypothetical protein